HATLHPGYIDRYRATGRTWIIGTTRELEGRRKDGTLFPVEINVSELGEGKSRQFIGVIRDITARKKAEERLTLAATVFEQAAEGIAILDERFHVTTVNPAFTAITGYDASDIGGQPPPFLRNSFQDEAFFAGMWGAITRDGRWQGELWSRRKSGERYAERLSVTAVQDERTFASHYVVVSSDVTQRRLDEERIRYQASHDMLTDLPNRALFLDRLAQAIDRARTNQRRGALLFLDLDGFKQVNDTLGHDVGDLLLREASRRLVHTIRANDLAARLGGDEFVVLMSEIERPDEAARQAQHIIETLRLPFDLDGYEAFISAHVGIALFPGGIEDSPHMLLKNATAAKTRAREQGKAGFGYFTPEITEAFNERLALKNSLTKALEREEFLLNYQPKLDLGNGRIIGVEALLRWKSPWLGPVPPMKFVPILEETGMIVEVGEWVLETACRQYRQWADEGHGELSIAVNLSARQLRPGIVATIDNILRRTGIDPKGLEIEITESLIMNDAEMAVSLLRQLSEMGIRLSMDDFGTGYSSLSHLRKFPLDTIKIDRSFIQEMTNNRDDSEIVRTIVTLGHALNRRVVAEGVETVAQLGLLNTLDCDEIQGYLLSPPVTADIILDLKSNSPAPRLLAEAGAVH
ncbi:MAG: EAL domain-containing protein, partial [Rhodospirillales bacterium]|nr:EAL domain-containing protein [Rhodospirillales bacterium]